MSDQPEMERLLKESGAYLEVLDLVRETSASVQGIGLILDRSNGAFDPDVEWSALYTAAVENYPPDECPLCVRHIPLTSRGRSGNRQKSQST